MYSSRKPVAIAGIFLVAVSLGAWWVAAHSPSQVQTVSQEVAPTVVPVFWGEEPEPTGADGGGLLTHGGWVCPHPDCRYRKLSGGQPFRSAKAQDCSLCRRPLVSQGPVAFHRP